MPAQKVIRLVFAPADSFVQQVPRALVVSVLALALDVCVLEGCLRILGTAAIPAAIAGYLAGCLLQYILCSAWVFNQCSKQGAIGFVAFAVLSFVGLAITWCVLLVAHDWVGAPVEAAKGVAVGLSFTWNFLSRKYLLFQAQPREAV